MLSESSLMLGMIRQQILTTPQWVERRFDVMWLTLQILVYVYVHAVLTRLLVFQLSVVQSIVWPTPESLSAPRKSFHKWLTGESCLVFLVQNFHLVFYACTGLNSTEVAHDHQVQVKKYVVDELKLSDTWHGMFVYIISVLYVTNQIWKYVYVVHVCYGI